jgi:hypothetical protein
VASFLPVELSALLPDTEPQLLQLNKFLRTGWVLQLQHHTRAHTLRRRPTHLQDSEWRPSPAYDPSKLTALLPDAFLNNPTLLSKFLGTAAAATATPHRSTHTPRRRPLYRGALVAILPACQLRTLASCLQATPQIIQHCCPGFLEPGLGAAATPHQSTHPRLPTAHCRGALKWRPSCLQSFETHSTPAWHS